MSDTMELNVQRLLDAANGIAGDYRFNIYQDFRQDLVVVDNNGWDDLHERVEGAVERYAGYSVTVTFYDEGNECMECYQWVWRDDWAGPTLEYFDGSIVCSECMEKDPLAYLDTDHYANNPDNRVTFVSVGTLEDMGYVKYDEVRFSREMYSRMQGMIEQAEEEREDVAMIFVDTAGGIVAMIADEDLTQELVYK